MSSVKRICGEFEADADAVAAEFGGVDVGDGCASPDVIALAAQGGRARLDDHSGARPLIARIGLRGDHLGLTVVSDRCRSDAAPAVSLFPRTRRAGLLARPATP